MKIEPVHSQNLDSAIVLLERGFPERSREFWSNGIAALNRDLGAALDGPIGYLLQDKDTPVGVVLSLRSRRFGAGEQSTNIVNFSGWYIDEPYRWYAPLMLKKIFRKVDAVFTDLTPSTSVMQMLPALKFHQWSEGTMLATLPQMISRYRSDVSVLRPDELKEKDCGAVTMKLLRDHERMGCVVCFLKIENSYHPLIFRRRRRGLIPHGYLIYAPNRKLVLSALGNICLFLLKYGIFAVAVNCDRTECPPLGIFRRSEFRKHYRGTFDAERIDYAYSEMVYFDL